MAIKVDFGFSEEQDLLKKSAREFLEKECPSTFVREMKADPKGYTPALWKKIADQGWLGLTIPAEYDGGGVGFLDLTILLEEMGRALLPGPFIPTVVLGAGPVMMAGTDDQKKKFLPKIASGEFVMTMAWMEPNAIYGAAGITATATPENDDYIINGTKLFVPYANSADWMVVAARTAPGTEYGVTLFLVDAKSRGIKVEDLIVHSGEKQSAVTFNNVKVPKDNILGAVDQGWGVAKKTLDQAAVAECARMIGGAQMVLDMTVDYAKKRIAFGVPIGSFQAVQHRTADEYRDVVCSWLLTYKAAWMIGEGIPADKEVSMAKAWTSRAFRRVVTESHQTHAGIGIYDSYPLGLYTQRAKVAEFMYGDPDYHLEKTAVAIGL